MNSSTLLAKHLRQVYFGGNWTAVNIKDTLADLSYQEATQPVNNLNTIVTLLQHATYYIHKVNQAMQTGKLDAKDELSFSHPTIQSAEDWSKFREDQYIAVELFAQQIESLTDEVLFGDFLDGTYGSTHRNVLGIIEHCHYHLGQIVLVKKLIRHKEL